MIRQRKGHTLIELVVSMAAGSTLMTLAMGLVHQTMTMSRVSNERAKHDRDSQRLVEQFRWDVHHSDDVHRSADLFIVETTDGRRVAYQSDANEVTRSEYRDGNTVRRENYALAESYTATLTANQTQQRATLEISFVSNQTRYADRLERQITAAVGRYRSTISLGAHEASSTRDQESP
ncbi:putative secreted protein [Rhodopirellula maiorica SM1]|uniref:Putative secreted protein n=1 Tax=Rhodopirellula maiorica SM1 TaxID=1265738 RepID=M5S6T4_9BACT|nr:prepilin-type N-terminal cleavage/methylation domain-containing protein [Rhodopirellula maiorica]EMI21894.1 putative secreted protein [Rhodopirellula maiorica SM1]